MNVYVNPDSIDWQKSHHGINVLRTNRLLERLIRFHGSRAPHRTLLPALVYECPVKKGFEHAQRIHRAFKARSRVNDKPKVTATQIIKVVARHFNTTPRDILSSRRTAQVVRPRQIIMYLAREHTNLSLPQIGRQLGGKDHTTILHGITKITSLRECDPALRIDLDMMAAELTGASA